MMRKVFFRFCLLQFLLLGSLFGKESLFLRAKGPYRDLRINVDDPKSGKCKFEIKGKNKGKEAVYIPGGCALIANPTYDLTFKSLFAPLDPNVCLQLGDIGNKEHAKSRLMSLLNSIVYPNFEVNPDSEHIIRIECKSPNLLAVADNSKEGDDLQEALTELRCDVVCRCIVQKEQRTRKESTFFVYFDIEMQRADVPGRINTFLRYREILQNTFQIEENGEMKLIAFLNYKTNGVSVANAVVTAVIIDPETKVVTLADTEAVKASELSKLIGLPAVVNQIQSGKEVRIVPNVPLREYGREWLKLSGTEWWADYEKRQEKGETKKSHRYVVPNEVSCPGVKEALQVLSHKGITDEVLQQEVQKIFSLRTAAEALEKRGEKRGEERGKEEEQQKQLAQSLGKLASIFVTQNRFSDDVAELLAPNSLNRSFVKRIWDGLNSANKTEKKYKGFLQELGRRKLIMK